MALTEPQFLTPYPIEGPNDYTISRDIETVHERLNRIEIKLDSLISILNKFIDTQWIRGIQ